MIRQRLQREKEAVYFSLNWKQWQCASLTIQRECNMDSSTLKLCLANSSMEVPDWCCSDSVIAGLAAAGTHLRHPKWSTVLLLHYRFHYILQKHCEGQSVSSAGIWENRERHRRERALGWSLEISVNTENVAFFQTNKNVFIKLYMQIHIAFLKVILLCVCVKQLKKNWLRIATARLYCMDLWNTSFW